MPAITGLPPAPLEALIEAYFAVRPMLRVAHHLPGRIRIAVSPKALGLKPAVDPASVERLLGGLRGIRSVRINRAAGSVVIDYDPAIFSEASWTFLLSGDKDAVARDLQGRLTQDDA